MKTPALGTIYSHRGNVLFPAWEQMIPNVGINARSLTNVIRSTNIIAARRLVHLAKFEVDNKNTLKNLEVSTLLLNFAVEEMNAQRDKAKTQPQLNQQLAAQDEQRRRQEQVAQKRETDRYLAKK